MTIRLPEITFIIMCINLPKYIIYLLSKIGALFMGHTYVRLLLRQCIFDIIIQDKVYNTMHTLTERSYFFTLSGLIVNMSNEKSEPHTLCAHHICSNLHVLALLLFSNYISCYYKYITHTHTQVRENAQAHILYYTPPLVCLLV